MLFKEKHFLNLADFFLTAQNQDREKKKIDFIDIH